MKNYMQSRKGTSAMLTQGGLLLMAGAVLFVSGGDPEKATGLTTAITPLAGLYMAAGGFHIGSQAYVDGQAKKDAA